MIRQQRACNRDVESFLDFCASDREFVVGLHEYIEEVIPFFEKASAEAEQELRWSAIHGEFLSRCEQGLLRWVETREGLDVGTFFDQIAALFDGSAAASEGLPLSFRLADYPSFLEEVLNRRDLPARIAEAEAARRNQRGCCSGVWRAHPDLPAKDLDRFLTARGTPAWLRGAAARHARSLRRAVVCRTDATLAISLDWGAFGHSHEVVRLDGTGAPRAWEDTHVHEGEGGYASAGIHVRRVDDSSDATLEEEWKLDGQILVWVRRVRGADGDAVELQLRFVAEKPRPAPGTRPPTRDSAAPEAPSEEPPRRSKAKERAPEKPTQRRESPRRPTAPPARPRGAPAPAGPPPLRPAPISAG